jgi:hypothetical protein
MGFSDVIMGWIVYRFVRAPIAAVAAMGRSGISRENGRGFPPALVSAVDAGDD